MNINSISFQNLEYDVPVVKDFIFGNIGDLIQVDLTFTSTATFDTVDFWFGIREGSLPLILDGSSEIAENNFINIQTLAIQKLIKESLSDPSFTITGDRSHSTTQEFDIVSLGANQYRIEHKFRIPYLFDDKEVSFSEKNESLRFFFKIKTREDITTKVYNDDSSTEDITSFAKLGNVGAFDETFSGNKPTFSKSFFTDLEEYNGETDFNAQLRISGNFAGTEKINFFVAKQVDVYDKGLTMIENREFEVLNFDLAAPITKNGSKVKNVSVTQDNATQITLRYTIKAGLDKGDYVFWAGVTNNDNVNPKSNNISGWQMSATGNFTSPQGSLAVNTFRFIDWHEDNSQSKDCFVGFTADDGRFIAEIDNLSNGGIDITAFEIGIRREDTGQILESFSFSAPTELNEYNVSRNRLRDADDPTNNVRCSLIGTRYTFNYGFQVWDEYDGDYKAFIKVSYTDGGNNLFELFESETMRTADYGEQRNLSNEPQLSLSSIEFFEVDGAGNIISGSSAQPFYGKDNLLSFTWTETNLGDMQADEVDLVGYIGVVNEGAKAVKESWQYLFSTKDPNPNTPLKEPLGGTTDRVTVTKLSPTQAKVEAILVWSEYLALFESDKPCFIARLDRACSEAISKSVKLSLFHFRDSGISSTPPPTDPVIGAACETDLSYKGAGNDPVSIAEWIVPNGEFIAFYINPQAVPDWFFIEDAGFNDPIGTGAKLASTGRTPDGNYVDPDPSVYDARNFPSNNGFIGSWGSWSLPMPDRTVQMLADIGFDASTLMVNAYDQVLWWKNDTGITKTVSLRVVPNPKSNTIVNIRRICP